MKNPPLLSVIVPVLNESEGLVLFTRKLLDKLGNDTQLIVVDGGSSDSSLSLVKSLSNMHPTIKVISSPKGRALQMNAGAKLATGNVLIFIHADTTLPKQAFAQLSRFSDGLMAWGRFDVCLDNPAWPYKVIAWFMNHRSRLTSIATGDQAIFVKRNVFEQLGGYPDQPLMEDVELSSQLKKITRPFCIHEPVITSARKWEKHGIIKTVWLMWKLRAAYARGVNPDVLVKQYYSD